MPKSRKHLAILGITLILAGCQNSDTDDLGAQSEDVEALSQQDLEVIALANEALDAVRGRLNDPSSAQFEGLKLVEGAICGRVNAKNRFGGYDGFRDFAFIDGSVLIHEDIILPPDSALGTRAATRQMEQALVIQETNLAILRACSLGKDTREIELTEGQAPSIAPSEINEVEANPSN